jgi:hypothetical protein
LVIQTFYCCIECHNFLKAALVAVVLVLQVQAKRSPTAPSTADENLSNANDPIASDPISTESIDSDLIASAPTVSTLPASSTAATVVSVCAQAAIAKEHGDHILVSFKCRFSFRLFLAQ